MKQKYSLKATKVSSNAPEAFGNFYLKTMILIRKMLTNVLRTLQKKFKIEDLSWKLCIQNIKTLKK